MYVFLRTKNGVFNDKEWFKIVIYDYDNDNTIRCKCTKDIYLKFASAKTGDKIDKDRIIAHTEYLDKNTSKVYYSIK